MIPQCTRTCEHGTLSTIFFPQVQRLLVNHGHGGHGIGVVASSPNGVPRPSFTDVMGWPSLGPSPSSAVSAPATITVSWHAWGTCGCPQGGSGRAQGYAQVRRVPQAMGGSRTVRSHGHASCSERNRRDVSHKQREITLDQTSSKIACKHTPHDPG